jgi:hypothetical protein
MMLIGVERRGHPSPQARDRFGAGVALARPAVEVTGQGKVTGGRTSLKIQEKIQKGDG